MAMFISDESIASSPAILKVTQNKDDKRLMQKNNLIPTHI